MTCDLSWRLIEDLESYDPDHLREIYRTPTLILQGGRDETVSWRTVVDFAAGCRQRSIELNLMTDGDHRMVDRLPYLGRLALDFLEARGVV